MQVFESTVIHLISGIDMQIDQSSPDAEEMTTLWKEAYLCCESIMSFSLNLIYDNLDGVVTKLQKCVNEMIESGKENV